MSRPVNIRESYERESATLVRILQAVRADPFRAAEWRERAIEHLQACISIFMEPTTKAIDTKKRRKAG
jgi:hypothetical protein